MEEWINNDIVVGICVIELIIPENHSLKGKRHVVKKIIERTKNKFNLSIAEVGDQELWQRCKIGLCTVGNDKRIINSVLDKVIQHIDNMHLAEIIDSQIELLHF